MVDTFGLKPGGSNRSCGNDLFYFPGDSVFDKVRTKRNTFHDRAVKYCR